MVFGRAPRPLFPTGPVAFHGGAATHPCHEFAIGFRAFSRWLRPTHADNHTCWAGWAVPCRLGEGECVRLAKAAGGSRGVRPSGEEESGQQGGGSRAGHGGCLRREVPRAPARAGPEECREDRKGKGGLRGPDREGKGHQDQRRCGQSQSLWHRRHGPIVARGGAGARVLGYVEANLDGWANVLAVRLGKFGKWPELLLYESAVAALGAGRSRARRGS